MSNEIEHVTADVGRVVPLFKGDYDADTQYELNDIVRYNNRLYWHTSVELTTGFAPTDDTVWKEAFVVLVDIDDELTEEGYAADAKAAGDAIAEVNLLIERSLTAEAQAQVRENIGLALDAGNNYSKLPDGTLIQLGTESKSVEAQSTGEQQILFDIPFIRVPNVFLQLISSYPANYSIAAQNHAISGFKAFLNNKTASAQTVYYDWIAIGRWK